MKIHLPPQQFLKTSYLGLLMLGVSQLSNLLAGPYVSDDFNYTLGANANGQNGGNGFGSAWAFASTGTGASATIVSGLGLSGIQSSGNALQISANENGGTVTGTLGRQFGQSTPSNSNLWGSFLIRQTAQSVPNGFAGDFAVSGVKFTPGSEREYFVNPKSSQGFSTDFKANIGVFKDPLKNENFNLSLDETFLVIYAFENINYGAFTGNVTTSTLWVLNQSNITALAGSFTVANLNANNQTLLTDSANFLFGTGGLTSSAPFQFFAQQGTVTFDEIRLGTTLGDVAVVPEPSTYLLLLGGFGFALMCRRQRVSL